MRAINVLLDKSAKLEASLAASCSGASSRTAVDLVAPLKAPGIVDAFSPSLADLSGISPGGRDRETGSVLFMGRVNDPRDTVE